MEFCSKSPVLDWRVATCQRFHINREASPIANMDQQESLPKTPIQDDRITARTIGLHTHIGDQNVRNAIECPAD